MLLFVKDMLMDLVTNIEREQICEHGRFNGITVGD